MFLFENALLNTYDALTPLNSQLTARGRPRVPSWAERTLVCSASHDAASSCSGTLDRQGLGRGVSVQQQSAPQNAHRKAGDVAVPAAEQGLKREGREHQSARKARAGEPERFPTRVHR